MKIVDICIGYLLELLTDWLRACCGRWRDSRACVEREKSLWVKNFKERGWNKKRLFNEAERLFSSVYIFAPSFVRAIKRQDVREFVREFEKSHLFFIEERKCKLGKKIFREPIAISSPSIKALHGLYARRFSSQEDAYSDMVREKLVEKVITRIRAHFKKQSEYNLTILFIGAADEVLISSIIATLKVCRVVFLGSKDSVIQEIKKKNDVVIERIEGIGDTRYDIVMVTHYWQHLPFEKGYERNLSGVLGNFPVKDEGLLVWISAVSRQSNRDEFVCEGFYPKKPTISQRGGDKGVSFKPMGVYSSTLDWVVYEPNSVHATLCNQQNSPWPGVLKELCLPRSVKITSPDLGYNDDDVVRCQINQILSKVKAVKLMQSNLISEYKTAWCLMEGDSLAYRLLTYSYNSFELNFLVVKGKESRVLSSDSTTTYTLFPCIKCDKSTQLKALGEFEALKDLETPKKLKEYTLLNQQREEIANVVKQVFEDPETSNALKRGDETYEVRSGKDGVVIRVLNGLENVFLNRYLIFYPRFGDFIYCTQLPIRRYLRDVAQYNKYIEATQKVEENEVCYTSATRLFAYKTLCDIFEDYGLAFPKESDVFFHNCFTSFSGRSFESMTALCNSKNTGAQLREVVNELIINKLYRIPSVMRDVWFNKQPLCVRLELLGLLNVHDVLIITGPCQKTSN